MPFPEMQPFDLADFSPLIPAVVIPPRPMVPYLRGRCPCCSDGYLVAHGAGWPFCPRCRHSESRRERFWQAERQAAGSEE